jgi:endonuclease YncB( thermonuclease family)
MGLLLAAAMVCSPVVVVDGDTLRCGRERVRLLSIDAPELAGHCRPGRECTPGDGDASRRNLARLIQGKRVVCDRHGFDAYGRTLARCSTSAVDLSCAQVAQGFAVERYGRLECRR